MVKILERPRMSALDQGAARQLLLCILSIHLLQEGPCGNPEASD